jgi:HdeA/HdeB family
VGSAALFEIKGKRMFFSEKSRLRVVGCLAYFPLFMACFGLLPAHAQTANLAQARCGNINELSKNDQQSMLFWLNGYYAGSGQRSSLDTRQVQSSVSAMLEACAKNPELPLLGSEARQIFLPLQDGSIGTPFQETRPQNRIVIPDAPSTETPAPQSGVSGSPSRSMTGNGNQRVPQPVP